MAIKNNNNHYKNETHSLVAMKELKIRPSVIPIINTFFKLILEKYNAT